MRDRRGGCCGGARGLFCSLARAHMRLEAQGRRHGGGGTAPRQGHHMLRGCASCTRVRVHVDAAPAAPAAPAVAGDDGADDETRQAARAHVASIGFDADRAEAALVAHGWNVEAAVAALLDD